MGVKILFQRLRCKHLNNFGGDMINVVSNHRHIYRSAWECENCGKIIYSEKLEPTCKITNWTLERSKSKFQGEEKENSILTFKVEVWRWTNTRMVTLLDGF